MSLPSSHLQDPADRLIVALDFPSADAALALVDRLDGALHWVKVGMELYYAAGPSIISGLRERGLNVFLDLKLMDIPNTVASAVRSVASLGAGLLTVHTLGGPAMLAAAQEAAAGRIDLLGVTVLTSMDGEQLSIIGLPPEPEQQVLRLGRLATSAGLHGLVCSPREAARLRSELGPDIRLVTPGIRQVGSSADDQRRTATPAEAIRFGASMLVVGRPITAAANPGETARSMLAEIAAAS